METVIVFESLKLVIRKRRGKVSESPIIYNFYSKENKLLGNWRCDKRDSNCSDLFLDYIINRPLDTIRIIIY